MCRDASCCRQGAAAGGEDAAVVGGNGDGDGEEGSAATVYTCPLLYSLYSGGLARPLGYLRAETPTRGEPAGPFTPGPPWEVGLPAGEGWADTGSAGNGGNVTSAGWPVILCDPIWHVSSRSGEASR